MKNKIILCLIVATLHSTAIIANQSESLPLACNINHKINGYKYLCMEEQGNKYDLEDKFNAFFSSIGFIIITPNEETELNETERQYVLYGTYETKTLESDFFSLSLTLRNKNGNIVYSSTKNSVIFFSLKKAINNASDDVIEQIKALNYSFTPTIIDNDKTYKSETKSSENPTKAENIKLARQMKADGMNVKQIEKYTGLTEEEINKL